MPVDETLGWAFRLVAPALVCFVLGWALIIGAAMRHRESRWGLRFWMIGASLLFIVPGLATLAGVLVGQRQPSASIFGIANVACGLALLVYILRHWKVANPQSD